MVTAPVNDVDILVDANEVRRLTSLSRTTIWKLVLENQFPKPIQLTPSRKAWRRSLVLAWITAREADPAAAYAPARGAAGTFRRKGRR